MYYSSGNYEAFARPEKPEGIENKTAYLIGGGLASLAAACFLVRDAQMEGKRIHILEKESHPGGALDGDKMIEGMERKRSHIHSKWLSISLPPRMT